MAYSTYSAGYPSYSTATATRHSQQPSILDLARRGNTQAIAYWLNSLLASQGIYVQADMARTGHLTLWVNFHRSMRPDRAASHPQRLVRYICYRLWTLNSPAILDVRMIGRMAGDGQVLWRQSVRIRTPANRKLGQLDRAQNPLWFRILRTVVLNRYTVVGFLLCYWFIHMQSSARDAAEQMQGTDTGAVALVQNSPAAAATPTPTPSPSPVTIVPDAFKGQIVYDAANIPEKVIALTFDDGPWENYTEQVLSILKTENIKATFFFVGVALQNHPELAKKVVADGHAVGNHTWQHLMHDMDEVTAAQELGNTAKLLKDITGVSSTLMRPPGGNLTGSLVPHAQSQGYTATMWSTDSEDYMVSSPLIVDNVLRSVKPGGIVLMHDGGGDRSATVEALPQIITALKKQGYRFVTMPELLAMQAKAQAEGKLQPSPTATETVTESATEGVTNPSSSSTSTPEASPNPGVPLSTESTPQLEAGSTDASMPPVDRALPGAAAPIAAPPPDAAIN